ncbi:MAG: response regulator [Anaerolineaceae bacterium]|nr:response regulator [Anaerolineaceae bacterium]
MRHPDDPHRTILVADDSIEMLTLYGLVVERMGYTALKAGSLDDVYQLLDETEVLDLILLGTYLDGQMYTDTAARLRQHPATADLPIIVVTHRSNPETLLQAFEVGINHVLAAPLGPHSLITTIQDFVG